MIWLTWRQHRALAIAAATLLASIAIYLAIAGGQLHHNAQLLASSACKHPGGCPDTLAAQAGLIAQFHNVTYFLLIVPALIGVFVGAPLVAREVEQQTYKTVWIQSVSRGRWFGVQVGLLLAGALVTSGVLSALVAWADNATLDQRYTIWGFDLSAIAPISYTTFALALGLAASALLRRTLPAIAVTIAGYLGVRVPILTLLRAHFLPPLTAIGDLADPAQWHPSTPNGNTDWILEQGLIQGGHKHPEAIRIPSYCPFVPGQQQQQLSACLKAHGWSSYIIYQPADRFWLFQSIESAIFFALAALLLALAVYWVNRRLS